MLKEKLATIVATALEQEWEVDIVPVCNKTKDLIFYFTKNYNDHELSFSSIMPNEDETKFLEDFEEKINEVNQYDTVEEGIDFFFVNESTKDSFEKDMLRLYEEIEKFYKEK